MAQTKVLSKLTDDPSYLKNADYYRKILDDSESLDSEALREVADKIKKAKQK